VRVLLDENLDIEVAQLISGHEVEHVKTSGWRGLKNGELLKNARAHYDAFVTLDRGILYQHNHTGERLIIAVLRSSSSKIDSIKPLLPKLEEFLREAKQGALTEIQ